MSDASAAAVTAPTRDDSPWARWGWVMWIVWLLFLIFPAADVLRQSDQGATWQAAGLALIVVFGIAYLIGAWRIMVDRTFSNRAVIAYLAGLLALTGLTALVIGLHATSLTPFLVSFAAFSLPRPWHWIFGVVVTLATTSVILATASLSQWGFFLVILVSVGVGVNVARLLIEQSYDYEEVQQGLLLTQERERVARDVHDVLGHSLTVISVKAGLAARLVDVDPARAKAEMAAIAGVARESLNEVRATVGGLRAVAVAHELAEVSDALASAGVSVELHGDPTEVDPAHRTVLGWVLREAATNIVRHAAASTCRITLDEHRLVVEDDGVGIGDARLGNGLRGLRERVEQAGATFTLEAGPTGRGTRLEVSWPT